MPRPESPDARLSHHVYIAIPRLPPDLTERLASELHRADRRLGVGIGGGAETTRLILMTRAPTEEAARVMASSLMTGAVASAGLPRNLLEEMEIQQVVPHRLGPGRPRSTRAPDGHEYRSVALPETRTLKAFHEGPTGDWIVYLEGAEDQAVAGRSLGSVLSELLELPHGRKDEWVHDVVRELAGHETPLGTRFPCPCCDFLTLSEPPPGTHAICPVCRWEDDLVQFRDLDYRGGANKPSLREARQNYREFGASAARRLERARAPRPNENPSG